MQDDKELLFHNSYIQATNFMKHYRKLKNVTKRRSALVNVWGPKIFYIFVRVVCKKGKILKIFFSKPIL